MDIFFDPVSGNVDILREEKARRVEKTNIPECPPLSESLHLTQLFQKQTGTGNAGICQEECQDGTCGRYTGTASSKPSREENLGLTQLFGKFEAPNLSQQVQPVPKPKWRPPVRTENNKAAQSHLGLSQVFSGNVDPTALAPNLSQMFTQSSQMYDEEDNIPSRQPTQVRQKVQPFCTPFLQSETAISPKFQPTQEPCDMDTSDATQPRARTPEPSSPQVGVVYPRARISNQDCLETGKQVYITEAEDLSSNRHTHQRDKYGDHGGFKVPKVLPSLYEHRHDNADGRSNTSDTNHLHSTTTEEALAFRLNKDMVQPQETSFLTGGSQTPRQAQSQQFSAVTPTASVSQVERLPALTPATLTLPCRTPGGTENGHMKLKSVSALPERFRHIFKFPYFNIVQSKVYDDALCSDAPLVVAAPTGSGKTALLELAIVRLVMQSLQQGSAHHSFKVVYMAPMKALCAERYEDWKEKFGPLGLRCMELTGDTEMDDYAELQDVNIVLTTPEKWDSMTRKWRDNKSLVKLVRLFLVDEVHLLHDSSRGATMEAVVSRMKTVQLVLGREGASTTWQGMRLIAVSATIPNIQDVAEWLSSDGSLAVYHRFDDTCRPVRLRKVVLGFPCSEKQSGYRFDLSLNYKLANVIRTYSDQKPTLVFCATRKSVQQAAAMLIKEGAKFVRDAEHKQLLVRQANLLKDGKLRDQVIFGVGYHHAGMDLHDRRIVEELFSTAQLPVLMATSTLALGVNLPAHLVIIKSTQHYMMGCYQEYPESQVLQMIGRAGRPQFDTSATAVIMTQINTKHVYEAMLNGTQVVESSLHQHLTEHLNAEVVLATITDVAVALEWIRSTFLYIRIMKNPKHYGMPPGLNTEQMERKLQDLCLKNLNSLAAVDLVKMDEDHFSMEPTDTGKVMARYCIAFETMKKIHAVSGTENLPELLETICQSAEFHDVKLRVNEKRTLNSLNKDKNRVTIRFPMEGKINSTEKKVNCLVQTQLGCLTLQDFGLQQDTNKIFRAGIRVVRCLVEVIWTRNNFRALLNAVLLSKSFRAKLWENSKFVSRQLSGIGPMLSNALVNAGLTSFSKLEETNPREIELIVNRHPPFGNQVREAVARLPKYEVSIDQCQRYSDSTAELTVTVSLSNKEAIGSKGTAGHNHVCVLLIGDMDNRVVFKGRVSDTVIMRSESWSRRVEVKRADKGPELSINFISQEWVGLDVQSSYTPFYTGIKRTARFSSVGERGVATGNRTTTPPMQDRNRGSAHPSSTSSEYDISPDEGMVERYSPQGRSPAEIYEELHSKPCNHRCLNKDICQHECCKFGVSKSRKRATNRATDFGQQNMQKRQEFHKYRQGLQDRIGGVQQTPVKRLKSGSTPSVDLKQFAYTPGRKGNMTPRPSNKPSGSVKPRLSSLHTTCTNQDVQVGPAHSSYIIHRQQAMQPQERSRQHEWAELALFQANQEAQEEKLGFQDEDDFQDHAAHEVKDSVNISRNKADLFEPRSDSDWSPLDMSVIEAGEQQKKPAAAFHPQAGRAPILTSPSQPQGTIVYRDGSTNAPCLAIPPEKTSKYNFISTASNMSKGISKRGHSSHCKGSQFQSRKLTFKASNEERKGPTKLDFVGSNKEASLQDDLIPDTLPDLSQADDYQYVENRKLSENKCWKLASSNNMEKWPRSNAAVGLPENKANENNRNKVIESHMQESDHEILNEENMDSKGPVEYELNLPQPYRPRSNRRSVFAMNKCNSDLAHKEYCPTTAGDMAADMFPQKVGLDQNNKGVNRGEMGHFDGSDSDLSDDVLITRSNFNMEMEGDWSPVAGYLPELCNAINCTDRQSQQEEQEDVPPKLNQLELCIPAQTIEILPANKRMASGSSLPARIEPATTFRCGNQHSNSINKELAQAKDAYSGIFDGIF